MSRDSSLVFLPSQLAEGSNRFEIEADIEELDLGVHTFLEPLRCMIVLVRTGDRIDLHLDLKTGIELECSRCGEPTDYSVGTSADVTFLPEAKGQGEDLEAEATDLEFYLDEIDLRGVVRDTFLLALPVAALCREDCRGLCPSCGANLNRKSCKCNTRLKPSPFEKLRRLVDG